MIGNFIEEEEFDIVQALSQAGLSFKFNINGYYIFILNGY